MEVNGLILETNKGIYKVHFILGLILGDNLGLNSILDFSKSFAANMFCRLCKSSKLETQKICTEDIEKMRNKTNYALDLEINCPQRNWNYKRSNI